MPMCLFDIHPNLTIYCSIDMTADYYYNTGIDDASNIYSKLYIKTN